MSFLPDYHGSLWLRMVFYKLLHNFHYAYKNVYFKFYLFGNLWWWMVLNVYIYMCVYIVYNND